MTPPPSPGHEYSEDALIEQPAMALFEQLGWQTANLHSEWTGGASSEGRQTQQDVVLEPRLYAALARINPELAEDALEKAVEILTRDRSKLLAVNANHEVYKLLKDGIKVDVVDDTGASSTETVALIDWRNPLENDLLLASQFWIRGELYTRRTDLVGFVNGIPLLFVELKASHKTLKAAYDGNLSDYRETVPQLFVYNAALMLSNASETLVGSTFAPWEHLFQWKRIAEEDEAETVSLETAIRGFADPSRFLDIVENFLVFEDEAGWRIKKLAKNHQYLGVNRAIAKLQEIKDRPAGEAGKLGVFWHTQGSGKSLSMVFFTQKIHRTLPGNWTFVLVTDRLELDEQLYKTFVATGAVTEAEAHADSGAHLQQLLSEDHRYVFTLIHKFNTRDGAPYPEITQRSDIIVITDEAHRSQYATLAMNMRTALPHAAFLGFTGTPLLAEEEVTREVFGDYVSIYDFAQSIADGATVPLYYENRIPELQLINEQLDDDLTRLLEEAELDEAQQEKVEQTFAREYHLITREDRLDAIAEDLVQHFVHRGHQGKGMMVCIDKATAVRMHEKVRVYWEQYRARLEAERASAPEADQGGLARALAVLEETDMAVVVSQSQNEISELAGKGLDITPHRRRMVEESLDERFKDSDDPLRLVFVCAMWITGFDVPSCSTIYLDKPMKNHTLMQTIARANRRHPGKEAGLIVDYVGVFRKLKEALSLYGNAVVDKTGGARRKKPSDDGETPIREKTQLVGRLHELLDEARIFLEARGVSPKAIQQAEGFDKVRLLDQAVEQILESDETKKHFANMARLISRVYRAILPDRRAKAAAPDAVLISVLAQKIKALEPAVDISKVMREVDELLDASVAPVPYVIEDEDTESLFDLSQIDFDKLRERFNQGRKRTEAERLRALLNQKLENMVAANPSRTEFMERFRKLIEQYNSGSVNIEAFFEDLLALSHDLNVEDQRAIREGLTEEELALFDIITRPAPEMTDKEIAQVKAMCRELLETLKNEKLVLDWRKKARARGEVERTVEIVLDKALPERFEKELYDEKCEATFQHLMASYYGGDQSVYSATAR